MKLLLDTHIWVWGIMEPGRVSKHVAGLLSTTSNELWLSPVSTWEILTLCAKNRLALQPSPAEWIQDKMGAAAFREAPLTHEVVLNMPNVDLPHRDPADQFLAATARTFDLTLITADENLIRGRGYSVIANR